jgi:hypothetical protein
MYTFVLLLIMLYIGACMGMELIATDEESRQNEEIDLLVETLFPNIWVSMTTLLQFVLVDSVADIYWPMVHQNPALMIFFVVIIMVIPISLMNLVTAVIVEGSLEQATQDREVKKAYKNSLVVTMMPKIEMLFRKLDADGSGDISLEEIEAAPPELTDELAKCFKTDDMSELFEILDVNQTGKVSIKEFCQELVKVVISERAVDQVRVQKSMISMRSVVNEIRSDVQSQGTELLRQQEAIYAIREDIAAIRAAIAPRQDSGLSL